jgi:hypothetical protein
MRRGKDLGGRLDKLERTVAPQRVSCVLDTPENRQLVEEGLRPADALPMEPRPTKGLRRLTKRDFVLFLSEAEWAC